MLPKKIKTTQQEQKKKKKNTRVNDKIGTSTW